MMNCENGSCQCMPTAIKIGVTTILVLGLVMVMPWRNVDWGKVQMGPGQVVTVTGEAKSKEKNQIARFSAGVNIVKDKKEVAVEEVNAKTAALVDALKQFGIPADDLKTQNISVYQQQDYMKPNAPTTWNVNSNIEIILRDVDKAAELVNLLNSSGANNVNGPTFSFDDTSKIEKTLVTDAIGDAREKAEIMAKASGRKLGKVVTINEGFGGANGIVPMYASAKFDSAMGGASLEAGSATITKSVTVTFELK